MGGCIILIKVSFQLAFASTSHLSSPLRSWRRPAEEGLYSVEGKMSEL